MADQERNAKKDEEHLPEHEQSVALSEAAFIKLKEDADKAKEYWDRLVRLQADMENMRKRTDKDRQDFIKFANEGVICDLLNVLDDLERTVELAQEKHQDVNAFLKGVEMILAHLYELLKKYGVRPIEARGKIFDPAVHEALMQVENKDLAEHTVVDELQKGYMLNDRVIRTTKVSVSKKS